ncbi:MAG: nucleotidyltransferase domain-containing protein [Acidobacteriaceae bacterium]|nr:nucleotidyltransferase domain-containing protein [Acidobacteriaceae bacterium]MBV9779309.1 nucleotidyltransferase domain-containing protein [Acidobacteriaceae bacterium]
MSLMLEIVLPKNQIAKIARKYEMKELLIFGSASRGELNPNSDIDLLVEFLPQAEITPFRHSAAERELSALLGRRVDLVSKRALRTGASRRDLVTGTPCFRSVTRCRTGLGRWCSGWRIWPVLADVPDTCNILRLPSL